MPIDSTQQKPALSRLLRIAVLAGVESAVSIHIKRGDDLDARDAEGLTPLMLAAQKNRLNICRLLLDGNADPYLCDYKGHNALELAIAAGSTDVAHLLSMAMEQLTKVDQTTINIEFSDSTHDAPREDAKNLLFIEEVSQPIDLTGWEEEPQPVAPTSNPIAKNQAENIQNEISSHSSIDFSVEWADVETFLPEFAAPITKLHDTFAREKLRLLFLRALREGSVPYEALHDLALNDDRSQNDEAERVLIQVINDLGAEVDERHEYSAAHESYAVYVEPFEVSEEEQELDDALFFLDQYELRRNESLRLFQRDFQHIPLLISEEEISLAQDMERHVEAALDALSRSVTGIEHIVFSSSKVRIGEKHLRWISDGKKEDESSSESTIESNNEHHEDDEIVLISSSAASVESELTTFTKNVDELWAEVRTLSNDSSSIQKRRNLLGTLRLSRPYLLLLEESKCITEKEVAHAFSHSMQRYKSARDSMVKANIKLAYSIAKKYSYYSAEIEDLLQEANLGLMKAVDRFSWKKGFKFSTYATWWIRQSVYRYIADKNRLIRLPVHIFEKAQKIERIGQDFERDHARVPSIEEISHIAGVSVEKVTSYRRQIQDPLSIHQLDIDNMIAVDVQDEFIALDPMDLLLSKDTDGLVEKLLKTLTTEDETLLRLRYGIGMVNEMTLEEIGDLRGITRERVRQIEVALIRKLKHPQVLDSILYGSKVKIGEGATQESIVNKSKVESVVREELVNTAKVVQAVLPKTNLNDQPRIFELPTFSELKTPLNNSIPEPVKRLLEEAAELGAQIKSESTTSDDSVWIDFTKAQTSPSRAFYRKMIASGFTIWGGRWSWR